MKYIYALVDPRNLEVRYVGCSSEPSRRFRGHLLDLDRIGPKGPKLQWLYELREYDVLPALIILEEVSSDWRVRERYWIASFSNLTNTSPGGEGGWEISPEARIRAGRLREWTPEIRMKLLDRWTPEMRMKQAEDARTRLQTAEVRLKRSVSNRQRWTPEMRLKYSEMRFQQEAAKRNINKSTAQ